MSMILDLIPASINYFLPEVRFWLMDDSIKSLNRLLLGFAHWLFRDVFQYTILKLHLLITKQEHRPQIQSVIALIWLRLKLFCSHKLTTSCPFHEPKIIQLFFYPYEGSPKVVCKLMNLNLF